MLLCIPIAKLDLEPGSVKVEYILARECSVCREEQLAFLVRHDPDDETHLALQCLGVSNQRVGYAWQSIDEDRQHSRHVEFLQVYLAVNRLGPSPLATSLSLVQIAQVGIVAETADEMEAVLMDAVIESTCGEECVGNDKVGQLQQILAVALDDSNVMIDKCHVALLQLKVSRRLMGAKHHAVVTVDVYQSETHNLQPMLHGTSTSRPETTDMRSLLARLADVARINGYGLTFLTAEVAKGERDVEAKPVQALRAQASEVLAVALFPCLLYLPNWVKFILPGITMYKSSTSMMTFSKLLLNFAAEVIMASSHMPVYWSSASEIFVITK